jgi:hypothetical protein
MTPASKHDGGRQRGPASETSELYQGSTQMNEFVRANSEAMVQAWTTAMCGMLNYQERLSSFVGMRMQKNLDMARAMSSCRDIEQLVDQQMAFGRTMIDDYLHESEELLQSALDIVRDSDRPFEARVHKAPHEVRQAVAS